MSLKYNKVAVLGAAKTGMSCANFFLSKGSKVLLSEFKKKEEIKIKIPSGIETEFGAHSTKILNSDLIIPSPGVHCNIPILATARKKNIKILSDIEIFYLLADYKMIIAITGTNGKTTTTSMVGDVLKKIGKKVVVCGNIGEPVCDCINRSDKDTYVVMEVSSYQLEYTVKYAPHISAILNITPDHLERHKTMKNYADVKAKIFKNQSKKDFCIFNKEDEFCLDLSKKCKSNVKFFSIKGNKKQLNLKIPGMHNIENALAAFEILKSAGIKESKIINILNEFKGVEHRIEFVKELNGVKYINDSKGTNVSSTEVALKSFDRPIILIMGGRDKGSPYTPLISLIKEKVKKIIAIGESKKKIYSELKDSTEIILLDNIDQAVKKAKEISLHGDIVLLSPACSSFDQFNNYEERGKYFKQIVNYLK
ncbi:MAG: UDP-N-acetylmuramoylalanine--D-glutamate ligase [Elusimicrobia bacterium RIFOXYD2_FULL_34_15]|nr:MAG: UDP-N-acetylmuramoylalanine--D-glutamate ligase [Elusimicrobia bacterium RIFOXYD2_FULL_34_15]